MPPARLLSKFGVLVIVVGNRRREVVSAPEVEKYGSGGGGGETNDGESDRRGRDGVTAGVAATIAVLLCKTLL